MTPKMYDNGEQLLIIDPTGERFQHVIRRKRIRIGHDLDNDIVLNGDGIAHRHVHLEWANDSWYVLEMESGEETRLGDDILPPSSTTLLSINSILQIGRYKIILQQRTIQGTAESNPFFPSPSQVAPRMIQSSDQRQTDYFSVKVWPELVQSGDTVVISVLNEGKQTNHYNISVHGDMRLNFSRNNWSTHTRPGMESRHQLTISKKSLRKGEKIPFEVHVESETGYQHTATAYVTKRTSTLAKNGGQLVLPLFIGAIALLLYLSLFR